MGVLAPNGLGCRLWGWKVSEAIVCPVRGLPVDGRTRCRRASPNRVRSFGALRRSVLAAYSAVAHHLRPPAPSAWNAPTRIV